MKRLLWVLLMAVALGFAGVSATPEAETLELDVPDSAQAVIYGQSGCGRDLTAYRFGTGENVLVVGFALHGFEDGWSRDGLALVDTAELLMARLDGAMDLVDQGDWTVYVLPCMNPDGLLDGSTCYGAGRCTTTCLDESGAAVSGGMDLNRSFPTGWTYCAQRRNYTGTRPLEAPEAQALAAFLRQVQGDGVNICIDTHGWYGQTITSDGADGRLFALFQTAFPDNTWADCTCGPGYLTAYAAELGYEACLFEFPDTGSLKELQASGHQDAFCGCILALLEAW